MLYFISFLEGIITFISPCMLPMLPVYVSYFAGSDKEKGSGKTLKNVLGFVIGFTLIFVAMGAFAGTIGSFMQKYQALLNIITGLIVIFFGLNFMGIFKLNIFRGMGGKMNEKELGFFSSCIFGIVFSIGWTPCVGTFLGSALMMASQSGSALKGITMLLSYSLGLGIPFAASALLIDKLKGTFNFIKKHYNIINVVCGILLILVGIMMMTGLMGKFLGLLGD